MRVKLIVNPSSGRYHGGEAAGFAEEYLSRGGNIVDVEMTPQPGQGIDAARTAAAQGYDIIVACGGDGTLREVVCGLVGSKSTLGIIPLGTGNVIATDLGIPKNPMKACRAILEGAVRRIDIGRCGENHFILAAGVGFDADVIAKTDLQLKSRVGNLAYIYAGLKHLPEFKPKDYIIEADSFSGGVNAIGIAVCNSIRYGGYRLKRDISISDGLFDVCVMTGTPPFDPLRIFLRILYRRCVPPCKLQTFKARYLRITSEEEAVVHNDGDVVAKLPMDFEVLQKALSVIVPRA